MGKGARSCLKIEWANCHRSWARRETLMDSLELSRAAVNRKVQQGRARRTKNPTRDGPACGFSVFSTRHKKGLYDYS